MFNAGQYFQASLVFIAYQAIGHFVTKAFNLFPDLCFYLLIFVTFPLLLNLVFLILGISGVVDLFLIKLLLVILLLLLSILKLVLTTVPRSLFLNLPANQLDRLQLVLNSAVRAVTKIPRFHHITPILKSLHWLKISQRKHYKILSIIYKCIVSNKPTYLRKMLTI